MKKAFCIGFVALLLCALGLTLLLPQATFSQMENRVLATLPDFSLDAVFSGAFMADMGQALEDQFPGRTFFVRAKASLDYLLGRREIGGAYIGRNGRLFEVFDASDGAELEQNADFIARFAQAQTGKVYFLPVYSAHTLYPDDLPAFAQVTHERALLDALSLPEGVTLIDPYDDLAAHSGEPIYFRTDHHWTQHGASIAYRAFCDAAGFAPQDLQRREGTQPFYGSLFSKAPLFGLEPDAFFYYAAEQPVTVTYDGETTAGSLYTVDALQKKDQYTFFLDGNHARVDIKTQAGTGRSLVVVKDSFAHALVPLLAAHYDNITMIDLRYYNLPLSGVISEYQNAEVLITYNLSWLAQDTNLFKLPR